MYIIQYHSIVVYIISWNKLLAVYQFSFDIDIISSLFHVYFSISCFAINTSLQDAPLVKPFCSSVNCFWKQIIGCLSLFVQHRNSGPALMLIRHVVEQDASSPSGEAVDRVLERAKGVVYREVRRVWSLQSTKCTKPSDVCFSS